MKMTVTSKNKNQNKNCINQKIDLHIKTYNHIALKMTSINQIKSAIEMSRDGSFGYPYMEIQGGSTPILMKKSDLTKFKAKLSIDRLTSQTQIPAGPTPAVVGQNTIFQLAGMQTQVIQDIFLQWTVSNPGGAATFPVPTDFWFSRIDIFQGSSQALRRSVPRVARREEGPRLRSTARTLAMPRRWLSATFRRPVAGSTWRNADHGDQSGGPGRQGQRERDHAGRNVTVPPANLFFDPEAFMFVTPPVFLSPTMRSNCGALLGPCVGAAPNHDHRQVSYLRNGS